MPEPIIITADDKRIRELLAEAGLLLSDYIAVDRFGWLEAHRFTVQDVINLANANVVKQNATSGTTNPDNAAGANGDFYYKIPADSSSLTHYQKIGGAWSHIFTVGIPVANQLIKQFPFTRADLTNIVDGMGELVLPFAGGQIAQGLISREEITESGVPKGALVANLAGGPVTSYNQIPDVDQYGIVYYIGEAVPFEATFTMQNLSDDEVNYTVGVLVPPPLASGDSINSVAIPGFAISVDVLSGQTCVYTVYDSTGGIVVTNTVVGPGSENGIPMTNDQSQEFIISNT